MRRPPRRRWAFLLVAALVALASGCRRPPAEARTLAPPEVEVSGCALVLHGPVCVTGDDGTFRVSIARGEGTLTVEADGGPDAGTTMEAPMETVGERTIARIELPDHATSVRVVRSRDGARGTTHVRAMRGARVPALDDARGLRARGELHAAAAALAAAAGTLAPVDAARAAGMLARIELGRGNAERAFALFAEAIAKARAAGVVSEEADDGYALGFALVERHRFGEARAALAAAAAASVSYADGRARASYYDAALASAIGDFRLAINRLHDTLTAATGLGLGRLRRDTEQVLALRLRDVGQRAEAVARLDGIEAREGAALSPCERASIATNQGWIRLGAEGPVTRDAEEKLEAALALYRGACRSDDDVRLVALNLAYAAIRKGDVETARARLADALAARAESNAVGSMERLDIEGRIHLASRAPARALASFRDEERRASASISRDAWWRALVGAGEAHEALGELDAADDAYARAERVLDDASLESSLTEGRFAFLGERDRSAQFLVDLRVRRGRGESAMQAARAARTRGLAGLEQRDRVAQLTPSDRARWDDALGAYLRARDALDADAAGDWKLAASKLDVARARRRDDEARARAALGDALDALAGKRAPPSAAGGRAPTAGELELLVFPARGQHWVAMARDARGVVIARVAEGAPGEAQAPDGLARRLLEAQRAAIARADRIRVFAYGTMNAVDFHALAWDGERLVAHAAIEYAMDLPVRARDGATEGAPRAAVIVADPNDNLPASRREALAVARALGEASAAPVTTLTGSEADAASVRAALAGATLFHFAGHGAFSGKSGWDSALLLASGARLRVGDVLALPSAPDVVVLSACEAGRASSDAAVEGLGLAHAFLVAGARGVVASTRVVDDALAAEVVAALYASESARGAFDPVLALRDAQRVVMRTRPDADWAAFRAFAP